MPSESDFMMHPRMIHPRRSLGRLGTAAILLLPLLAACEGNSTEPAQMARVQVLLTDLPIDALASAEVAISHIYLTGGGEGQVDLFRDSENPHRMNLLDLQDGVTLDLTGEILVPEGSYGQLRFVVDEARVTLAEGFFFSDQSVEKELTVPSGFFRVILHGEVDEEDDSGNLELEGGETSVILVDFDIAASFVFQGPPLLPNGVMFKPVLRQLTVAP